VNESNRQARKWRQRFERGELKPDLRHILELRLD
jgi:hypothetical protein